MYEGVHSEKRCICLYIGEHHLAIRKVYTIDQLENIDFFCVCVQVENTVACAVYAVDPLFSVQIEPHHPTNCLYHTSQTWGHTLDIKSQQSLDSNSVQLL